MGKIIKYGILIALVYFIVQNAPRWVEEVTKVGSGLSRKTGPVSQSHCLPAAERASEAFSEGLRDYAEPPFDIDAWDLFMEDVQRELYSAESRCNCPRDSCQRATDALSELSGLMADFDNSLRGDSMPLNPARRQETIDRFLKRARELDRQGN